MGGAHQSGGIHGENREDVVVHAPVKSMKCPLLNPFSHVVSGLEGGVVDCVSAGALAGREAERGSGAIRVAGGGDNAGPRTTFAKGKVV